MSNEIAKCPACKKRVKIKPVGKTFCNNCNTFVWENKVDIPETPEHPKENEIVVEAPVKQKSTSEKKVASPAPAKQTEPKPIVKKTVKTAQLPPSKPAVKKEDKPVKEVPPQDVPEPVQDEDFDFADDEIEVNSDTSLSDDIWGTDDEEMDVSEIDWTDDMSDTPIDNNNYSDDEEKPEDEEDIQEESMDEFFEEEGIEPADEDTMDETEESEEEPVKPVASIQSTVPIHRPERQVKAVPEEPLEEDEEEFFNLLNAAKKSKEPKSKLAPEKEKPKLSFKGLQEKVSNKIEEMTVARDDSTDEDEEDETYDIDVNEDGYYDNVEPEMDAECEKIKKDFFVKTGVVLVLAVAMIMLLLNIM